MIERTRSPEPDGHHFVPGARLVLSPALRTSGLLAALPGEEAKTLLMLLTFLTPQGAVRPSLPEVADGLRVPQGRARERLRRLEAFRWEGRPLLRHVPPEPGFGLDRYVPDAALFDAADAPEPAARDRGAAVPNARPAGRAAVVAHSRAMYGRLRADVERDIEARLREGREGRAGRAGRGPAMSSGGEGADPGADLDSYGRGRAALLAYGVPPAEAERLLAQYGPERVLRQAGWMPLRGAREPARFLASAVVRDFGPPLRSRLSRRPLLTGDTHDARDPGGAAAGALSDRAAQEEPEHVAEAEQAEKDESAVGESSSQGDLDGVSLEVPE